MRIATWNINSIKAHFEQAARWLKEAEPDVLCLQEIKCEEQAFPALAFEEMGYRCIVSGQKTYNGVALLSRLPFEDVVRGLPGDDNDTQARYVQATVFKGDTAVTIATIYLPNGNPPETEKYPYKLSWMERLKAHAEQLLRHELQLVLAGDYNVIPDVEIDCLNPNQWRGDALALPQTLHRYRSLEGLGLTDAVRALNPGVEKLFTFYDYQAGAWQKGNGIRIDHLLLSPQAADMLQSARIDAHVRGWEKPSDHVPVSIDLY